jgi:glycosyltransferase involved in cell wall biosynthesis
MRVLIDSLYAGQKRGTGISTYARTLSHALRALGHDVSWLSGAPAGPRPDILADAASLADDPQAATGLRRYATTARRMAGGWITSRQLARPVDPGGVLLPTGDPVLAGPTFVAPNLYVHAHYRHMLRRDFLDVALPSTVDVLHLTAPLPVRMREARTVVTIHDLVPLRLPDATPDNKAEFAARVRRSVREADHVLTVSEASKADIVSLLGVDPERISVTYQPTDLVPLGAHERGDLDRALTRFGLEQDRYALFVGALEPKKNIRRLIEAFLDAETDLTLAVVGGRAWMWERELGDLDSVLGAEARARIRFPGYVAREDLRRLYAGARLFVFPSLYEGFGLPALDALGAGVPVIASRTGSLPEVCGEAAVYVDPFDRSSLRDAIGALSADAGRREVLSRLGPAQADKFSFDRYVRALGDAYGKLQA